MRLAFWKKEDKIDLDKDLRGPLSGNDYGGTWSKSPFETGSTTNDLGLSGYPQNTLEPIDNSSYSQPSAINNLRQQVNQKNDVETLSKNIEIISSKMDALKAMMESLSQRIANIEKIAMAEQEKEETPQTRYSRW